MGNNHANAHHLDEDLLDDEEHVKNLMSNKVIHNLFGKARAEQLPRDPENGIRCIRNYHFQPWMDISQDPHERRIEPVVLDLWLPETAEDVRTLVHLAAKEDKVVRVSGYRHTSSNLIAEPGAIMISFLEPYLTDRVPEPLFLPTRDWKSGGLKKIQLDGTPYEGADEKMKHRCRIGAGATNYHFRDWVHCHDHDGGKEEWALPMNVVMTEISFGGSNGPICHGAGRSHGTLSDLVKEITFVNCHGELQTEDDPELLKAMAGCFGMMGVVVELVLELEAMTYANLSTVVKKPLFLTVPPTANRAAHVPHQVFRGDRESELEQREVAEADFRYRCEHHYYSEFFWFPLQHKGWTNTWKNDGDKHKSEGYPRTGEYLDRIGTSIAQLINAYGGQHQHSPSVARLLTRAVGALTMSAVPNHEHIVCTIEDAEHFHHGIQNVPCLMIEFNIEVPSRRGVNGEEGEPMWEICQEAWWDVIDTFYDERFYDDLPMRTTLEMRITSGSSVIMAPQHGNSRTCSIEVLTPSSINREHFQNYVQAILDKWGKPGHLVDEDGRAVRVRPHWAKTFEGYTRPFTFRGQEMVPYLKDQAYPAPHRAFFIDRLNKVGAKGEAGKTYTFQQALHRFGNSFLKGFYGEVPTNDLASPSATTTASTNLSSPGLSSPASDDS